MLGFGDGGRSAGWERRRIGPVYSDRGMIASAHPLITATGIAVLQQGGNAVDAAVAAGITAAVVMPEMCGLGGDLFAIVHDPQTGKTESVLGSGISPRSATIEQMRAAGDGDGRMPFRGPLAVGVPGMVDAYFTLLSAFGSRSFAQLAEYGIHYAAHGHPLTQGLRGRHRREPGSAFAIRRVRRGVPARRQGPRRGHALEAGGTRPDAADDCGPRTGRLLPGRHRPRDHRLHAGAWRRDGAERLRRPLDGRRTAAEHGIPRQHRLSDRVADPGLDSARSAEHRRGE